MAAPKMRLSCNKEKDCMILQVPQKNTEHSSCLFCDEIEFYANHIMVSRKGELVFKVWLDEDNLKNLKDIYDAIKSVGMKLHLE